MGLRALLVVKAETEVKGLAGGGKGRYHRVTGQHLLEQVGRTSLEVCFKVELHQLTISVQHKIARTGITQLDQQMIAGPYQALLPVGVLGRCSSRMVFLLHLAYCFGGYFSGFHDTAHK